MVGASQATNVQKQYKRAANTNAALSQRGVVSIQRKSQVDQNPLHDTQSEQFSRRYDLRAPADRPANVNRNFAPPQREYTQTNIPSVRRVKHKKNKEVATVADRVQAVTISRWVSAWMWWIYLSLQLPFAVLSIIGLGAAYAVDIILAQTQDGASLGELATYYVVLGAEKLTSFTPLGLTKLVSERVLGIPFDPILFFMIGFALIALIIGVLHFLIVWFAYSVNGIHSLSGEKAGKKMFFALLFIVGASIPGLNLFPVFHLWLGTVSLHPK